MMGKLSLPIFRKKDKIDDTFQCMDDCSYASEADDSEEQQQQQQQQRPAVVEDFASPAHSKTKKPNMMERIKSSTRLNISTSSRNINFMDKGSQQEVMADSSGNDEHDLMEEDDNVQELQQQGHSAASRGKMLLAPSGALDDMALYASSATGGGKNRGRLLSAPSGDGLEDIALHASANGGGGGNNNNRGRLLSAPSGAGLEDMAQSLGHQAEDDEDEEEEERRTLSRGLRQPSVLAAPSNEDLGEIMGILNNGGSDRRGDPEQTNLANPPSPRRQRRALRQSNSFDDSCSVRHEDDNQEQPTSPRRQRRPLGNSNSSKDLGTSDNNNDSSNDAAATAPTIRARKSRKKRPEALTGSGSSNNNTNSSRSSSNMEKFLSITNQRSSGRGSEDALTVSNLPSASGGGRRLRQSTRVSGCESVVGDVSSCPRTPGKSPRNKSLERKAALLASLAASPLARNTQNSRPTTPTRSSKSRPTTPTRSSKSRPPTSTPSSMPTTPSRSTRSISVPPLTPGRSSKSRPTTSTNSSMPTTPSRSTRSISVPPLTPGRSSKGSGDASLGPVPLSHPTKSPRMAASSRSNSNANLSVASTVPHSPSTTVDRVIMLLGDNNRPQQQREQQSSSPSAQLSNQRGNSLANTRQTYSFRLSPSKPMKKKMINVHSLTHAMACDEDDNTNKDECVGPVDHKDIILAADPVITCNVGNATATEKGSDDHNVDRLKRDMNRDRNQRSSQQQSSNTRHRGKSCTLSKLGQHNQHRISPTSVASVANYECDPQASARPKEPRRRSLSCASVGGVGEGGGDGSGGLPPSHNSRQSRPSKKSENKVPSSSDSVVPFSAGEDKGGGDEPRPSRHSRRSRGPPRTTKKMPASSDSVVPFNAGGEDKASGEVIPSRTEKERKPRGERGSSQRSLRKSEQRHRSDGSARSLSTKLTSRQPRNRTPRSDGSVMAAQLSFLPNADGDNGISVQYKDVESVISNSWK